MRFHRHRIRYWSNSPTAKWLFSRVGVVVPYALTAEGWDEWEMTTRANHPVLYNLIENKFNKLQNFIYYPFDFYDHLRSLYMNAFVTKTHYLDTKLKKGQWHEADTRLLHGAFGLLVDFIEVEKAHMLSWSIPEEQPWWFKLRRFKLSETRSAENGIKYLEWEAQLTEDNGIHFTAQAIAAQEQLELYNWWKNIRPNRPDPHDISGWSEHCETLDIQVKTRSNTRQILQTLQDIETQYDNEDSEMLIRLITIRKHLWT